MYGGRYCYSQLFGRGALEEVSRHDDCDRLLLFQNGMCVYLKENCGNGSQRLMRPLLCSLDDPIAPSHLCFDGPTLFGRIRAGHKGHCERFESFLRFRYGHSPLHRLLHSGEQYSTSALFYITKTIFRAPAKSTKVFSLLPDTPCIHPIFSGFVKHTEKM
jgi:hypothetical protein